MRIEYDGEIKLLNYKDKNGHTITIEPDGTVTGLNDDDESEGRGYDSMDY
jgi:hypothetical protein